MNDIRKKAEKWLNYDMDNKNMSELQNMLNNNEELLTEAFYKDLEFGTGGLRGIMGVGTNRMNKFTVGMTTQGLSNYLLKTFKYQNISVAITYDCRNNSRYFAEITAAVFSANGIKVYLFDELRPTPELSFAIRTLKCKSGVMITASHNPKEYNGYKVYWEDGAQIINPHDKNIINEVRNITEISQVKFSENKSLIEPVGEKIDKQYIEALKTVSLNPDIIQKHSDLKIVYTPIHGTGVKLVPMALKAFGFSNVINVPEQDIVDGNFPTVHSPNPEEPAALVMAINKAKETDADIVMGTDPDADRVGIVVRARNGEYILLNGNQTASILIYYLISQWKEKSKLKGKEYIVKTIVTSELLTEIADYYGVETYDVLTGFKYIAAIIRENEGKKKFIGGGEESYGYLAGEFVRDKDAVMSCALIAEVAAWAKEQDKTLLDILKEVHVKFGFYKENLLSVTKKGKSGAEEIAAMMDKFRNKPPDSINGSDVVLIHDFEKQTTIDRISDLRYTINLPKSNVLQFDLHDGSKISIRPSGTEPKIKFYFSVKTNISSLTEYDSAEELLNQRLEDLKQTIQNQ
ncbi:MAG TPA: phospho-sugar mutase [Bacteroidales bacterium]|nr:phospho-sugar mutase [Bacteroidales bacterium]